MVKNYTIKLYAPAVSAMIAQGRVVGAATAIAQMQPGCTGLLCNWGGMGLAIHMIFKGEDYAAACLADVRERVEYYSILLGVKISVDQHVSFGKDQNLFGKDQALGDAQNE